MDKQLRAGVVFHLTGRHADGLPAEPVVAGLRPALIARYRELESLRYDFPVILGGTGGEFVQSLSSAVDGALREVAPGHRVACILDKAGGG